MANEDKEPRVVRKISAAKTFDDADIPLAAAAVKNTRVALSNLQLYPPESRFIKDSLALVHAGLEPLLAKYGALTLSEAEGKLLVNSRPLSQGKEDGSVYSGLIAVFAACNIRSAVFKSGLTLENLSVFIKNLGLKKPFGDDVVLGCIELEDKVYIGAGEADLLVEGGVKFAADIEEKLAGMCKGIESVASASARADEYARIRDKEKTALLGTMSAMDPSSLMDLLVKDLPPDQERVKYDALRALPPAKMKQIADVLAARSKQAAAAPPASQAQAGGQVKQGIDKLFDLLKDTAISAEVYNDLAAKGLGKQLPAQWAESASRPEDLAERQARAILERDEPPLLDAMSQGILSDLVRRLDLFGKSGLVTALLTRLLEHLYSSSPKQRLQAARALSGLMPALEVLSDPGILRSADDKLVAACEGERDPAAYPVLCEMLVRTACRCWRVGHFGKTLKILTMLRHHADNSGQGFAQRADYARKAMERVSGGEMMHVLVSDLSSADPQRLEYAVGVTGRIGLPAAQALLAALKKNDDLRFRRTAAGLLRDCGPEGLGLLLGSLDEARTSDAAMKIISVLDSLGCEAVLARELEKKLAGGDPLLRRFALLALNKVGGPSVNQALLAAARDKDAAVRRESVRLLGERRCREAVDLLLGVIKPGGIFSGAGGEDEDIQAEACFALGKIGDHKAVHHLVDSALPAGMLALRKTKPLSVRKAAVLALHCFKVEKAMAALKALSQDDDPQISSFASAQG